MANTYSQIYVHVIFAVQARECLLKKHFKEDVHKYITGIIHHRGQKLIAINSMPDHIHLLIGLKPDVALSDLVRDVKAISAKFINEKKWFRGRFRWQEGFAAFSYSHSQVGRVVRYIQNQEIHHAKNFRDEYLQLLRKFQVEFDHRYILQASEVLSGTGRP
jgi:putative transposase